MDLNVELGRPLTPQELAQLLGVSTNTVRKYRERWGGVEVAPGTIRFFENKVKEMIHASTNQEIRPAQVARSRNGQRNPQGKDVPRRNSEKSESRRKVGRGSKTQPQEPETDRHGLADLG